ncbi:hypothetical protein GN244_ATG04271 [Phytophthora infestans]|uniref:Secreted RxLR effector peptide protein n=1 Tax=Phytophthora infestans TaxID=4787 RepID=A0A833WZD9_PHYIN|nr:hypothetical protein GN244_ATG04271 [Phytophthora infestans]
MSDPSDRSALPLLLVPIPVLVLVEDSSNKDENEKADEKVDAAANEITSAVTNDMALECPRRLLA